MNFIKICIYSVEKGCKYSAGHKKINKVNIFGIICLIQNAEDTSAVIVTLHGWGDDANTNLGWTELYFEPEAGSGSVIIDLSQYYGKDYYNIFAGVCAQPDAKIGDTFAPGFEITNAHLLVNYNGNFSETIDPVSPIPNLPKFEAVAGDECIELSWDPVPFAESYMVKYIDKSLNLKIALGTTETTYTINNLTNGTTYDVLVYAVNVNGTSSWTYKDTTATSYTVSGLTNGKTYDILVLAYNGTKWSSYTNSDIVNAAPKA